MVLLANIVYNLIPSKKQEALLSELSSKKAIVQGRCMMRENGIRGRGAAQIKDGMLIACNVWGNRVEVPLKDISVTEHVGLGKIGWFGKRIFELKSQQTMLFALAFSPSQAPLWRQALNLV